MQPCGDQPRDVRHIHHEERADRVRNRRHALKINDARVRRCARDDQLRLVLVRQTLKFRIVDAPGLAIHAVGDEIVVLAREVDRAAVRKVSAVRQIHAHDRVAVLQKPDVHRGVCLCAAVRLHIDMLRAEQLLCALDRGLLHAVDAGAAAVIAVIRVAFCIFIRKDRACGEHHRVGNHIFGCNQLKTAALPVIFRADCLAHLGVTGCQFFDFVQYHCPILRLSNVFQSSLLYTKCPRFTRDSFIFSPFA